ncbi:plasminogen [Elysia marginata]|uniref:Plasminogen n=1 Tax=Elysia marginata TaxID=1093978 RepID=A0AAV4H462_9GAST|nr:plasminogen [Elysia marginata]
MMMMMMMVTATTTTTMMMMRRRRMFTALPIGKRFYASCDAADVSQDNGPKGDLRTRQEISPGASRRLLASTSGYLGPDDPDEPDQTSSKWSGDFRLLAPDQELPEAIGKVADGSGLAYYRKSRRESFRRRKGCGLRPMGASYRVVGGQEVIPHSWPWQVGHVSHFGVCGQTIMARLWSDYHGQTVIRLPRPDCGQTITARLRSDYHDQTVVRLSWPDCGQTITARLWPSYRGQTVIRLWLGCG